jgi:hypothetical protein
MRVSLTVSLVAASLAAAPVAATAAPSLGRPFAPPVVLHGAGKVTHAFWRDHGGDHDFWRHRQAFVGAIGGFVDEAAEPEEAPPLFFSAPFFVDAALAPPDAGPPPVESAPGPKIIEIGQSAPPRRHLPLVIYGD